MVFGLAVTGAVLTAAAVFSLDGVFARRSIFLVTCAIWFPFAFAAVGASFGIFACAVFRFVRTKLCNRAGAA
jgi:hypothetical protein